MKKRYLLLVVFLLLCSVVTACKDKLRGTSEPSRMPSMTVTSSPMGETVTPTESLPYVTWGLYFDLSISDDLKNEINTILQEKGNLYLYEKLGYHQTGKIEHINERMDIVFYEKD